MSRNPRESTGDHVGRRTFMKASAAAGFAGAATGTWSATSTETYVIEQDGVEHEVTPLSYENQTIEEFYGYREDGNTPHSYTPTGIEQADTSALFLYEGPEGLSLVMLHDTYYDGGGGSVRFEFSGLPSDGGWAVQDDPGEGYSRTHADWNWVSNHTDGGAYRGLEDVDDVTVTPNFRSGIRSWQALSGDAANPERIDLDRSKPITIRPGSSGQSLADKADTKQSIIDNIRQQNEDIPSPRNGGLLPPDEASSLDSRAQQLVDTVRTNLDSFTDAEQTQYGRALDIVTATERAGLAATTKPIQVARQTSGFLIKTIVMYAVEKIGEIGRVLGNTAERISNLPGIRSVTDFVGNVADVVFGTVKRHVINAISGSAIESVIDTVARFVDTVQEYAEAALGSGTIREIGKTAATKTVQEGVKQTDDGVIGTLKDMVAEVQEEIAGQFFEDYYLSEIVLIAPFPGTRGIEQNIDDTSGIDIGPIHLEPPNLDVPDPLEGLEELETLSAIQDAIDRFTPGGIDTTMDERAARAAAGAEAGSIEQNYVEAARTASGVTETVCRGVNDACLFVFDTVYGFVEGVVNTIENALVVGGLLAFIVRKLASSFIVSILAAILEGTAIAVLGALGKLLLALTALEVIIGSLVLRITANLHWAGTLAAVNPALFPAGSDSA